MWHHKYYLQCTKIIGFIACRVTSKSIGIGYSENSLVDVRTTKSGKIIDPGSEISEKHSILYTSACIKGAKIGKTLSNTNINDSSHSHSWNDEDRDSEYE